MEPIIKCLSASMRYTAVSFSISSINENGLFFLQDFLIMWFPFTNNVIQHARIMFSYFKSVYLTASVIIELSSLNRVTVTQQQPCSTKHRSYKWNRNITFAYPCYRLNALENAKKTICIVGLTERQVNSQHDVINVSRYFYNSHVGALSLQGI